LQTYAELATTRPVLQAVIDDNKLDIRPDKLKKQFNVTSNEDTQMLTISVQDEDPTQAAAIANTVADMLVRLSPSGAGGSELQLNDQMRSQAAVLEESIASTEAKIKQLEADLTAATSAETQPLLAGNTAQGGAGGTEARIKQLEADLQAAANLNEQHLISNETLAESIASTEARIKQLEADLIAAGVDTQRLILDQIARERDHLSELERADLERQSWILDQILQGSIANTQSRITQLEADFETAVDVEVRRLISGQIALERNYLSELRQADVEGQRRMLEQTMQDSVAGAEARITQLEADLQAATGAEVRREVLGQITQERQRLSDAERANLERQRQTIDQLLQLTMTSIEAMIAQLQTDLLVATTELEAQRITDQISQERTRLSDDHRTLASLYGSLKQSLTNQVRIVEPAIAGEPADAQLKLNVLIGAMAGLVLSLAIVLAFEYLDDSVKTVEDLGQVTDVPILGAIAKHKALKGVGRERLAVWALPDSRAAEGYRALSTKLVLSKTDDSPRSLLVISPDLDHDAGEIAANLAITIAQTGKRVVLVDANLRYPTVGRLFGLDDRGGLTDALTDQPQQPELASIGEANLSVLPSGATSSNPFDQIASPHMASLIAHLTDQADVVIIAAPTPTLYGETMLLASLVDGVILAVRSGETRREAISAVLDNLRSVGARIVGVVLDNNRRRSIRLISRPMAVTSSATDDGLDDEKRSSAGRRKHKAQTSVQVAHQTRPGLGD
jgi:capsular exopolysaccharide synthesis family protein